MTLNDTHSCDFNCGSGSVASYVEYRYHPLDPREILGIDDITNYTILNDRIFWIYFIVTLFFVIIGLNFILSSTNSYMLIIGVIWLLTNVALMIMVYHASTIWGPTDENNVPTTICFVDYNSHCVEAGNNVCLFINIVFILLLIFSVLWAGELSNTENSPLRTMSGVLILLGGLLLCNLVKTKNLIIPFWYGIAYLIMWFGLTLYVVITPA